MSHRNLHSLVRYPLGWYTNMVGGDLLFIDAQPRSSGRSHLLTTYSSVLPPFFLPTYHLSTTHQRNSTWPLMWHFVTKSWKFSHSFNNLSCDIFPQFLLPTTTCQLITWSIILKQQIRRSLDRNRFTILHRFLFHYFSSWSNISENH